LIAFTSPWVLASVGEPVTVNRARAPFGGDSLAGFRKASEADLDAAGDRALNAAEGVNRDMGQAWLTAALPGRVEILIPIGWKCARNRSLRIKRQGAGQ
jgi:hypothetical protein